MFEQRIKNFWEGEAGIYSDAIKKELENKKKDAWKKLILDSAPKKDKLKILDIGCGPGFFSIILSKDGHDIIGTDLTENMIEEAKQNAKNQGLDLDFRQMDCKHLDFDDDTFDLVICRNVTWTLDNPIQAYSEWKRVLNKGGKVLIFDANWYLHEYDENLKKKYEETKVKLGLNKEEKKSGHKDPEELNRLSKNLFMSDKHRPGWDLVNLIEIGYSQVFANLDLDKDIYEENDSKTRLLTPMFMVGAVK